MTSMNSIAAVLPYIQILLSLLLIGGVLLQQSSSKLGGAFGDGDSFSGVRHTRRGLEKTVFFGTIAIAILFVASAFLALLVR